MFNRSTTPRKLTWQERAVLAEAELTATRVGLEAAQQHLDGIELRMADRAVLISITKNGRMNKFTFVRNGQMTVIETYGSWDDDPDEWREKLLKKDTPDGHQA